MDISKFTEAFINSGIIDKRLAILRRIQKYVGEGTKISNAIEMTSISSFLNKNNISHEDAKDAYNWWNSLTDEEKSQYE